MGGKKRTVFRLPSLPVAAALGLIFLAACRANAPSPALPFAPRAGNANPGFDARSPAGNATIDHVVIVVQENRSFDTLFRGFPGADTVGAGYGQRRRYALRPIRLTDPNDITHSHLQFLQDYDRGANDGFDREIVGFTSTCRDPYNEPSCWVFAKYPYSVEAYSYVRREEIQPYWTMAARYALSDRTFASNNGPSYTSHQYLISGQSRHVVDGPSTLPVWGCNSKSGTTTTLLRYGSTDPPHFSQATGVEIPGPFPCFRYRTAADLLDAAGITWTYYAPELGTNVGQAWSAFDAIWTVRSGPDWNRSVRSPETRILDDIGAGRLAQVVWVVPSFRNSDHAGSESATGPDWVASIVNAIGRSRYWRHTAIVVTWDDWGGWYDHVPPPQFKDPQTGAYEGLGFRVPLIVVSPYAKRGYVSHERHEIASTLHFVEKTFGLASLGGADARADALEDMFDFARPPASFRPIPTRRAADFFRRQPPSSRPPDD